MSAIAQETGGLGEIRAAPAGIGFQKISAFDNLRGSKVRISQPLFEKIAEEPDEEHQHKSGDSVNLEDEENKINQPP